MILPSEVEVTFKSMESGTLPGRATIQTVFVCISSTIDEGQPVGPTGFRKKFRCVVHIQTVSRIIEVCQECRLFKIFVFVGYGKALDSVETNAIP